MFTTDYLHVNIYYSQLYTEQDSRLTSVSSGGGGISFRGRVSNENASSDALKHK